MKDFIPIPTNICRQQKIVRMMMREACAGFGAYLQIIMWLRECDNYQCTSNAEEIAVAAMVRDVELVERLLSQYELFEELPSGMIHSAWLDEQMRSYDSIKQKRSAAGRASAAARKKAAEEEQQMLIKNSTSVEQKNNDVQQSSEQSAAYNTTYINNVNNINNHTNAARAEDGIIEEWGVSEKELDEICRLKGDGLSGPMIDWVKVKYGEKHVAMTLVKLANEWQLCDEQFRFLWRITNRFVSGDPRMQKLVAIARKALDDKFSPKYPMNFLTSKLRYYGN